MSSDLLVKALKVQIEELKLARTQANEVVAKLMDQHLSKDHQKELFELVGKHLNERDIMRSDQLIGVMRSLLLGLNMAAQSTTDAIVKRQLVAIIEAVNVTLGDK